MFTHWYNFSRYSFMFKSLPDSMNAYEFWCIQKQKGVDWKRK